MRYVAQVDIDNAAQDTEQSRIKFVSCFACSRTDRVQVGINHSTPKQNETKHGEAVLTLLPTTRTGRPSNSEATPPERGRNSAAIVVGGGWAEAEVRAAIQGEGNENQKETRAHLRVPTLREESLSVKQM